MILKRTLRQILPDFIKTNIRTLIRTKELREFNSLERQYCVTENLMPKKDVSLSEIFNSEETERIWEESKKDMDIFNVPNGSGGVNPGDRRAIYYLINKFKPTSVLEIGTHIGASTINIAAALFKNQKKNKPVNFTTLDIRDVNSASEKPWEEYGTKYSPIQMINELNYGDIVNFVTGNSLKYLNSQKKFDFIFLDGDHSAATVYKEIPLALKSLHKNGVILLHDYYPEGKPLWSDNFTITGPYSATERLIREGANLVVLPLGTLPWDTKLNSNITSLALLMRKN
ncbi:Predicted O-methyltransferase YrrM [Pedobacter sp. ok626]|uniref:O-methyltransferase n=1 Tax=Pedobacter sp. ok626 TaxID=1761882 RepID=UPI00088E877E|nr:class I SAM-dependent methyltransferase [Pedobacter sp. ok626]SDJ60658.1 Predicted O-methyltransferase YrrM [Pedobacter sp. ok626]